jgi:hypothetical protein
VSDAEVGATRVTLSRAGTVKSWAAAAISIVFGASAVVGFFAGAASVPILICGLVLLAIGVVAALAAIGPADWLQIDPDAISQWHGRRQLWQLRWQHMAEVRFVPGVILLVPLDSVAGHPEISPALDPHDVDGVTRLAFDVQLGPVEKAQEAARAAITQHAPPRLLAQSSPRPPST